MSDPRSLDVAQTVREMCAVPPVLFLDPLAIARRRDTVVGDATTEPEDAA